LKEEKPDKHDYSHTYEDETDNKLLGFTFAIHKYMAP
jgi:hypothetical protein